MVCCLKIEQGRLVFCLCIFGHPLLYYCAIRSCGPTNRKMVRAAASRSGVQPASDIASEGKKENLPRITNSFCGTSTCIRVSELSDAHVTTDRP